MTNQTNANAATNQQPTTPRSGRPGHDNRRPRTAAVVGGSVAGLATALGLARRGWRVVVFERDRLPHFDDPDEAFGAKRTGVPQTQHAHLFLARARATLAEHAPDVLERMLSAGAWVSPFSDHLPETLVDRLPREGDDELGVLFCRRTTLEAALRAAVRAQPEIELRDGVTLTGLLAARAPGGLVRITGVRDRTGQPTVADVVIDASGRHSPVRRWMADLDVALPPDHVESCGIMYVSRYYRLRPGQPRTLAVGAGQGLGTRTGLGWGISFGDGDTMSVSATVPTGDRELMRIRHRACFDAVATAIPDFAAWVSPDRCTPLTDPLVMGGLVNRRRFLVDDDGRPLVLGLHAVGDALAHTNPVYTRGCTLALIHAFGLADQISDLHDPHEQALAAQALVADEIDPWYWSSVVEDRAAADAPPPGPDQAPPGGLSAAVERDPETFRRIMRIRQLLDSPQAVYDILTSPAVAAYENAHATPAPAPPSRDEILAILAPVAA